MPDLNFAGQCASSMRPNPMEVDMSRIKKNFTRKQLDEAYAQMTLYSDVLSQVFFKDNPEVTSHVLRIILDKPDLVVTQVKVQNEIANPFGHSVRFDVLATDSQNDYYNIEIQNANSPHLLWRADYYGAAIKMKHLEKKAQYCKMPNAFVIFITRDGYHCNGRPINHIQMRDDDNIVYDVGTHIVFVNGQCKGPNPLGNLMHDFECTDPAQMRDPVIAEHFIKARGEKKTMDAIQTRLYGVAVAEGLQIGLKKGIDEGIAMMQHTIVANMLSQGMNERDIVRYSGLAPEIVSDIIHENGKK